LRISNITSGVIFSVPRRTVNRCLVAGFVTTQCVGEIIEIVDFLAIKFNQDCHLLIRRSGIFPQGLLIACLSKPLYGLVNTSLSYFMQAPETIIKAQLQVDDYR
jgi:hypothetical protein